MTRKEAQRIAYIAHAACGQYRADRRTPYFEHPKRVAFLVHLLEPDVPGLEASSEDREVAAWLHDVLEDTKLSREHLLNMGITYKQLDMVERLTKPDPHGAAPPSYYQRISESVDALVVKCADRMANLEDALAEVLVENPTQPRRWAKYVAKTRTDVLPMYASFPKMREALEANLDAIERSLPSALERRAATNRREDSDSPPY